MKIKREELPKLLHQILKDLGGKGTVFQVSKLFWEKHKNDLKLSGKLFYKWQYDIRWAALTLRKKEIMKSVEDSTWGVWELNLDK